MENHKKQLVSGVLYTAMAKYAGIVISLVVTGVLSRLLSPDDFGVVAIATVIIAFFGIFTDMGLSPAIVQHRELTEKDLSNIFSFTLWSGVSMSVLFFAASWPIANYYNNEILRPLCQWLSINLLFASVNIVPNALFYKHKEFKFIAIRSFAIQTTVGVIAVVAALCGVGLYALLINPILSGGLIFAISFRRYPQQIRYTLGLSTIRKIFGYSAYQFLFNIIVYFSRNLDKLLIGKFMGMAPLGYYEKSYRLMTLPLQNITQVITPVMHPVFSDFQNDRTRLASSYERIVRLLAFIGLPLSVWLFFCSTELMVIIFGTQWLPSVPVFRILSLSVGIQVILSSSGSIFQAAGDTRSLFICGLFSAVLNVSGILLGVFYWGTLEAVAWCISVTFTLNFVQCYHQMYRVTLKRSLNPLLNQLGSPLLLCALCVLILLPLSYGLARCNALVSIALKGIIFLIISAGYIQATHEYDIIENAKQLREKYINKNKQANDKETI